jgi:hypothetical protein
MGIKGEWNMKTIVISSELICAGLTKLLAERAPESIKEREMKAVRLQQLTTATSNHQNRTDAKLRFFCVRSISVAKLPSMHR